MRRCVDHLIIIFKLVLVAVLTRNGEVTVETRLVKNFKLIDIAIDGVLV